MSMVPVQLKYFQDEGLPVISKVAINYFSLNRIHYHVWDSHFVHNSYVICNILENKNNI